MVMKSLFNKPTITPGPTRRHWIDDRRHDERESDVRVKNASFCKSAGDYRAGSATEGVANDPLPVIYIVRLYAKNACRSEKAPSCSL